MRDLVLTMRRALWLSCVFVLLSAGFVSAGMLSVSTDLDGDGHRDAVSIDLSEPSVLRIWLSATGTTSVIPTKSPMVGIVAVDLDGDHRPELVARDTSSVLRVWTRKRTGFRRFHPRQTAPSTLVAPRHHSFDDGPTAPASELSWDGSSSLAVVLTSRPRAPADRSQQLTDLIRTSPERICRLFQSAPRPPPRVSL